MDFELKSFDLKKSEMKKIIIVVGLLAFFLLVSTREGRAQSQSNSVPNFARGATLWSDTCVRCHNLRSPMDFSDSNWKVVIFHMRAKAGLSGQNARDILHFLQASNSRSGETTGKIISVNKGRSNGKFLYQKTCIACHGANGKGAIPQAPDMTVKGGPLFKSKDLLIRHALNGFQSKGSSMAMPPKGGDPTLSNQEIVTIVDYMIQTFKTKK